MVGGKRAEADAVKPLPAPPPPPPSSPPTATLVSHPHSLHTLKSSHMVSLEGMEEGPSSKCVSDLSKSPGGGKQAPSVESVDSVSITATDATFTAW